MVRMFGFGGRRHPVTTCIAADQSRRSNSLIEHGQPGDGPAYYLTEPPKSDPDRTRLWVAGCILAFHVLVVIGLFVLVRGGAAASGLMAWQGAIGTVGALSATLTTYYFIVGIESATKPKPDNERDHRPVANTAQPVATVQPPRRFTSVALIGSFRRNYEEVCQIAKTFEAAGLVVMSPAISTIVNHGANFVRFAVDPPTTSDEDLQALALRRILAADFVYVVAPDGYIGRTTCYELGSIIDRKLPLYFSHRVDDLPIHIANHAVRDAADLAAEFAKKSAAYAIA